MYETSLYNLTWCFLCQATEEHDASIYGYVARSLQNKGPADVDQSSKDVVIKCARKWGECRYSSLGEYVFLIQINWWNRNLPLWAWSNWVSPHWSVPRVSIYVTDGAILGLQKSRNGDFSILSNRWMDSYLPLSEISVWWKQNEVAKWGVGDQHAQVLFCYTVWLLICYSAASTESTFFSAFTCTNRKHASEKKERKDLKNKWKI